MIGADRAWALAHPQHYAMLFGIRPAGATDSTEAIVAVHGGMLVLLGELSEGQERVETRGQLDMSGPPRSQTTG